VDKRLRRWATTRVIPLVAAAVLLVVGVNVGIEWNPLHGSMGFAGAFDVWRSYGVTDQILNATWRRSTRPHRLDRPPRSATGARPSGGSQPIPALSVGGSLSIVQAPTAWPVMELWCSCCRPLCSSPPMRSHGAWGGLEASVGLGRTRSGGALERCVLVRPSRIPLGPFVHALRRRRRHRRTLGPLRLALRRRHRPPADRAGRGGVAFAFAPARRWLGLGARIVVAPLVVVVGPLIANWHEAFRTLHCSPRHGPRHVTPWAHLAPRLSGASVSAAPLRSAATLLGFVLCVVVCRRGRRWWSSWRRWPPLWSSAARGPGARELLRLSTVGCGPPGRCDGRALALRRRRGAGDVRHGVRQGWPRGEWLWPIVVAVARWPWSSLRGREVAGEERTSEEQRRFSPRAADPVSRAGRDTLTSPLLLAP